ncbi:conserved repeat domain protein [Pedosphaera parvula Ellin514]|uniref:Conserved repeat domain protein n=2 Tax=Pedosphaera TaxID=1032526 RepID=B9XHY9_PEDPL|nr:conserved repeat domain protein [Pedosphaera parvula Ellin514]
MRHLLAKRTAHPGNNKGLGHLFCTLLCTLALISQSQGAPGAGTSEGHHKVQVNDPTLAREIQAEGGKLVADYGGYQVFQVPQLSLGLATNHHAEIRDDYNTIQLNAIHLDSTKAEVKALRKSLGNFQGKHLHLVHFVGPVQPQWRDELEAAGVKIVSYIPENAYLVYGDAASLAKVQGLATSAPHIQWDGVYEDEYKIHPGARTVGKHGKARLIGTEFFAIQLIDDAEANTNTVQLLEQLKLEPIQQQHHVLHYLNLVVRLSPADLMKVAAQPDVISIQPYFSHKKLCERQDQIIAGNLTGSVPSGPGYLAWLASKGFTQAQFTASGFAVDVSDSGVDDGTTVPNHFGLYTGGLTSSSSRVIYNRLEGTANAGSTLSGCDGHGNLNTHIIGGYDNLAGFPFADSAGFHYGLGVCPFVKVGSSVVFDPSNFTSPIYNNLIADAYHSGARVSNNSWGSSSAGAYDIDAQSYDALVRDAEQSGSTFPVAGNQEMVIVFAAGNDGPGASTVGSPGSAKNVLTVGAAENVQAFGGSDGSGISDTQANSANDIIYFSSRGPCSDGRHKPEIVAPGTHVSGGVAQAANPAATGTADGCFTGEGVSGGVGIPYFPAGQQFYTASSGTSHSTPCVAGGSALLRQYFINNFTNPASPAMTKAYLMNSARYLNGAAANDTLWSDSQGMGEMNLGRAFDGTPRILRDQVVGDLFTASGQTRTFTGTISDTNKPFRVTVAWTDAPGSTTGNAYNNDLDLTVTVGGVSYKGNVFSGAFSIPGGSADTKNNAESVIVPAGVSGPFAVTITAANINSDGVPNNANAVDQDFALVIYNVNGASIPVLSGAGVTLSAETCFPTNNAVDPGESVTMSFALQNVGTLPTTNLTATLLATGGVTSPSGSQNYGALTAGGAATGRPFTFTASGTCGGTITATMQLQDGATSLGTVNFQIQLGLFNPTNALTENFDGVTAPALPSGWSTTSSGSGTGWGTSTASPDTSPNGVFVSEPDAPGISALVSPSIAIISSVAQVTFRNNYDLEEDTSGSGLAYDGGVLEIQIGAGAFTDILAAGGSFVTGGYNRIIDSTDDNAALDGRQVWSGSSGGFITTTVNLPAAAAGKNIVLRWRAATDSGNDFGGTGWYIDSVSIADGFYTCCSSIADLSVSQKISANPTAIGQNVTYTTTITNLGPSSASSVTFTDALPANVTFVSASPGCTLIGTNVVCNLGTVGSGTSSNIIVTVNPTVATSLNNKVAVAAATSDPNTSNNTSTLVSLVHNPVVITTQPTNQTVLPGGSANFQVGVTGTAPLGYQWLFNGTNLAGATTSILGLANVQTNQAGAYSVVITNDVSSITSGIANLRVLVSPRTTGITTGSNNVAVSFTTVAGLNYTLEYKNTLNDTSWVILPGTTPGTGGTLTLHDTNALVGSRFYRILVN